jgi:hypothetical protein
VIRLAKRPTGARKVMDQGLLIVVKELTKARHAWQDDATPAQLLERLDFTVTLLDEIRSALREVIRRTNGA